MQNGWLKKVTVRFSIAERRDMVTKDGVCSQFSEFYEFDYRGVEKWY